MWAGAVCGRKTNQNAHPPNGVLSVPRLCGPSPGCAACTESRAPRSYFNVSRLYLPACLHPSSQLAYCERFLCLHPSELDPALHFIDLPHRSKYFAIGIHGRLDSSAYYFKKLVNGGGMIGLNRKFWTRAFRPSLCPLGGGFDLEGAPGCTAINWRMLGSGR